MDGEEERQCYICLASEDDTGSLWVSPCRCAGTMAWVHSTCVLQWIRQHDAKCCSQCLTRFKLIPEKGPVVEAMDVLDRVAYPWFCLMAGSVMAVILFDCSCTAMGMITMVQAYGIDEVQISLLDSDSLDSLTRLHLIGYGLLMFSYFPWDDYLLWIMRQSSALPVLDTMMPSSVPSLYHPRPPEKSLFKVMVDAALLPLYAKVVGELFFRRVDSTLSRMLVGGVAFLTAKAVLTMYYKQKVLMRRRRIRILPNFEL